MLDIANPDYDPLTTFKRFITDLQQPYSSFTKHCLQIWVGESDGLNQNLAQEYIELWLSLGLIEKDQTFNKCYNVRTDKCQQH